jgi:hypothetical protein
MKVCSDGEWRWRAELNGMSVCKGRSQISSTNKEREERAECGAMCLIE